MLRRKFRKLVHSLRDVAAGENLKFSLKQRVQENLHEIFNTKVPIKRKVTEKKYYYETKS